MLVFACFYFFLWTKKALSALQDSKRRSKDVLKRWCLPRHLITTETDLFGQSRFFFFFLEHVLVLLPVFGHNKRMRREKFFKRRKTLCFPENKKFFSLSVSLSNTFSCWPNKKVKQTPNMRFLKKKSFLSLFVSLIILLCAKQQKKKKTTLNVLLVFWIREFRIG